MKISMYSIYDRKSNEYWSPKVAVNDDSIKRDFAMMVNEPGTLVFGFPADFELYEVGSFDTVSGKLEPNNNPYFICSAKDLIGVVRNEK